MERVVSITLFKSPAGEYTLNISPLNVPVSPRDAEGAEMQVRWLLQENPTNPDYPNAKKLVVKFNRIPTPFTIVKKGEVLPDQENYITAVFSSDGDPKAEIVTASVRDDSVGQGQNDEEPYKYTISVITKDDQEVKANDLDPWVRVRRRSITTRDMLGL